MEKQHQEEPCKKTKQKLGFYTGQTKDWWESPSVNRQEKK